MTTDPDKSPAGVKYADLRSDGTAYIAGGSLVAGVAAYAYHLLGGRTLGAEAFAPVSVLLTIHFLTFIVLLLPIEQLVVRRLTIDGNDSGLPLQAWVLGTGTTVGATVFAWLGVDRWLNGDVRFVLFAGLTVAAHFAFSVARGHLAGRRRFKAYGMTSGSASLFRLAIAVGVTLVHPSASGLAIGLVLGPLITGLWRPYKKVEVEREALDFNAVPALEDKGLLPGLVLAAATSQALLLTGPIVVGLLGGSAVEISIAFAAFTLGRAPLTFGYNLLARVLPPFTEMAAKGERQELRAWARGMAWASLALALVGAALGWFFGPWVVEIAFGADFVPARSAAATIAFGVVFAGGGLFVGQILVAGGEPVRLGLAWLWGLAGAAAALLLTAGFDPVGRVGIAFVAGEAIALTALVAGAVLSTRPRRPERGSTAAFAVAKRTVDIAVSLSTAILAIPLVLVAGLAIRLDSPGPVFFSQTRIGRNGQPFGLLKIRTMRADGTETVFAEHLARLQETHMSKDAGPIAIEDDVRITRVGRFLRRSSIDELPNLWNVLRGHMSLVGPRPLVLAEAELIGLDNPRFTVKPGITGLAQVKGRDTITLAERTRLDEEYVRNRNGRLDASILIRTLGAILARPGY